MIAARAKPAVDPLEREKTEAENRAMRDEIRRQRVLHAKTRIIGVDTQTLQAQIHERERREQFERERNAYFDKLTVAHANAIKQQDNEMQRSRWEREQEIKLFNAQQAREKKLREIREQAGRVEPVERIAFDGEDHGFSSRTHAQKLQQQDWLAGQISELCDKEAHKRAEQDDYEREQARLHELLLQNEAEMKRVQHARNVETKNANLQMAREKQYRELQEADRQRKEEDRELTHTLTSALLNEAPGSTVDSFKGFTTAERQAFLDAQARQQQELNNKRAEEQQREREDAMYMEHTRRERLLLERERANHDAQERVNLRLTQKQQEKEQKLTLAKRNAVYANEVTDEFFDQFGKSCR